MLAMKLALTRQMTSPSHCIHIWLHSGIERPLFTIQLIPKGYICQASFSQLNILFHSEICNITEVKVL